jgi:hypothetical protein
MNPSDKIRFGAPGTWEVTCEIDSTDPFMPKEIYVLPDRCRPPLRFGFTRNGRNIAPFPIKFRWLGESPF